MLRRRNGSTPRSAPRAYRLVRLRSGVAALTMSAMIWRAQIEQQIVDTELHLTRRLVCVDRLAALRRPPARLLATAMQRAKLCCVDLHRLHVDFRAARS